MDTVVPRSRKRSIVIAAAGLCAVVLLGILFWSLVPKGMRVRSADLAIGAVQQGTYLDEILVRAIAEPQNSIVLDSVESGRVEEVAVTDGAIVAEGALLFRLSNTERRIQLLQRSSEVAQQVSNLQTLKVALEASKSEHQRRQRDLEFSLSQTEKQRDRYQILAAQGMVTASMIQELLDKVAHGELLVAEEKANAQKELAIQENAVRQMESLIRELRAGLVLVNSVVEALEVRAPLAGRLADFNLQVGQTVKQSQNIGRIDDPSKFKLIGQVDQYYLSRINPGQPVTALIEAQSYSLRISHVATQIKTGRFTVEMLFDGDRLPPIKPGQNFDVKITLGQPTSALVLPNGPFFLDTGGVWVYVLSQDGRLATRRNVQFGRRNNSQLEVLQGLRAGERVILSGYSAFGEAERLEISN